MTLDSILFFSVLVQFLLIINFSITWFQHRKEFRGGITFLISRAFIALAYLGSTVMFFESGRLLELSIDFLTICGAILLCLCHLQYTGGSIAFHTKMILVILPLSVIFNDLFLFPIINSYQIRIAINSVIYFLTYSLLAIFLYSYVRDTSRQGFLLLITALLSMILFLFRSVSLFFLPMEIDRLGRIQGGFYTVSIIMTSLLSINWPFGFILMVLEGLKNKEKEQSKREMELYVKLERADRLATLGTLASGVAHEINNPNNYIMLNAQNLRDIHEGLFSQLDLSRQNQMIMGIPANELRSTLKEMSEALIDGSKRISRLTNSLKEYVRPDQDDIPEDVTIDELIESSSRICANLIKKSTSRYSVSIAEGLPHINASRHKLEQVFINLINNACQSLTDRTQAISITAELQKDGRFIKISVTDEGSGIPESIIHRVTDPFYTSRRAQGGTGLGLSICERIVLDGGGAMNIFSDPDKTGTSVEVSIPV